MDLFDKVFPNLIVDLQNYQPTKSFPATLAFIFRDNTDPMKVRATLNSINYPNNISDKVELLLMLNDMDKYNILTLLKKKIALPGSENDIREFGKLSNNKHIEKFADYKQQTKSQDFMHLKGPEIAKAMNQAEKNSFLST